MVELIRRRVGRMNIHLYRLGIGAATLLLLAAIITLCAISSIILHTVVAVIAIACVIALVYLFGAMIIEVINS